MVYSRSEPVFILDSRIEIVVRVAFYYAYPDREIPNKTIYRTGKKNFGTQEMFVTSALLATKQLKLHPYRFQAVHRLQQQDRLQEIIIYIGFVKGFILNGSHFIRNVQLVTDNDVGIMRRARAQFTQ